MAYFADRTKYRCVIKQQGFGRSSVKGTPNFWLEVLPIAEVKSDGSGEFPLQNDYRRVVRLWITEKTAERTVEILRGLGWPGGSWSDLDPDSGSYHDLNGVECTLECTHETNTETGKTYDNFNFPAPGGSAATPENESSITRDLDNLYGAALKKAALSPTAVRNQAGITAAEAKAVVPTPDDEIPF